MMILILDRPTIPKIEHGSAPNLRTGSGGVVSPNSLNFLPVPEDKRTFSRRYNPKIYFQSVAIPVFVSKVVVTVSEVSGIRREHLYPKPFTPQHKRRGSFAVQASSWIFPGYLV